MNIVLRMLVILLYFASCTTTEFQKEKFDYWSFLDGYFQKSMNAEYIKKQFGNPREKYENIWIYDNNKSDQQEWSFVFNSLDEVTSIIFIPSKDFAYDFSLNQIKDRWKKFDCQLKEKQRLRPGLISKLRTLECDKGKRIVEINKYNEVLTINLNKLD
jgi:hypothetical protein